VDKLDGGFEVTGRNEPVAEDVAESLLSFPSIIVPVSFTRGWGEISSAQAKPDGLESDLEYYPYSPYNRFNTMLL